jgi:heat shock protein HslJ
LPAASEFHAGQDAMTLRFQVGRIAALAACMALAGLPAGAEDKKPPQPLPPWQKSFPLDQTWSLRELNGKPVASDTDVSFKLDGSLRGSGYTGCNTWSATIYPIPGQKLAVGPFALTKKQCAKDVMATELGFLSALIGQPTWDLVNDELVIKGPRGQLRLVRSI